MKYINFRAWDKLSKCWVNILYATEDYIKGFGDQITGCFDQSGRYEFILWTGFLDKDCKQIWQGDILKNVINEMTWEVIWGIEDGQWLARQTKTKLLDPLCNRHLDQMKIIGNIYHNK